MNNREDSLAASELASGILERYRQVYRASREGEPLLRHGRRSVAVSTIAQQFYCEKAVQLSIERPRAPTPEMLSGLAGHEAVASLGVALPHEEAVTEAVATRELPVCMYEFRIGWRHGEVTVLGFVDEAWFKGGSVVLVAERKFSGSLSIRAPYHVQAALYCLGLGEMGFNADDSHYRISVFKRECHDCARLRDGECPGVAADARSFTCDRGACTTQEYPFDRHTALHDLNWALEYWTFEREAQPTSQPARCLTCRHRSVCDVRRQ